VALVTTFQIPGLKIWFWSNDHEPPHFHVKQKGEWEVKVSFLEDPSAMIEIVFGKPKSKALKELTELTEQHRLELLEQWQRIREMEAGE
jgi:Domain of unknown function (DUF4160)